MGTTPAMMIVGVVIVIFLLVAVAGWKFWAGSRIVRQNHALGLAWWKPQPKGYRQEHGLRLPDDDGQR